jgi:hypothetical protein
MLVTYNHFFKIKTMADSKTDFLSVHQQAMGVLGFWTEEYRESILKVIELRYSTDVIREWTIIDFVTNGDKVLVKWAKRLFPLTDDDLKEKYNR